MDNLKLNETESDFRQLLQDVQANRAPVDALLEDETFNKRLRIITRTLARTEQDAEDLASDVRVRVWRVLSQFRPNYDLPYGYFFAWLRVLTRNIFRDTQRRRMVEFDEHRVEDLELADNQTDIEQSILYKEVIAEFEKSINALPFRERLAVAYYLQGFTFRQTSEKMREAGFPSSSHIKVRKWITDGLNAFLKEPRSKTRSIGNVRVTKVRATRAKREFYTILEQAINSGTADIVENIYRTPLAPVVRQKRSETTQPTPRLGWQSASDLLSSMQTAESKRGVQAAFDSSPEELGRAAVDLANSRRKIPVGSLTTFLMAASTVNVLGRVMNLTKDAA